MGRKSFLGRKTILEKLTAVAAADKLGQPFLMVGPQGCGKENTALEFARLINCAGPANCSAETRCESCVKTLSFQHPDVRWICPSPASVDDAQVRRLYENKVENPFFMPAFAATSNVRIGDPEKPSELTIRSLIHFLRKRSFQGRYKVAIVADSHRFNPSSANAFLKTLEEPSENTVIFLLTTSTDGMLPTILSRCQKIAFKPWTDDQLQQILIDEGGADKVRAAQVSRMAEGNARQALAMLDPAVLGLVQWASRIFDWVNTGQRGMAAISADEIHRGVYSHTLDIKAPKKGRNDKEKGTLADSRGRAIRLCELLVLHYSDAVACKEMADDWKPRLPISEKVVASAAGHRKTDTMLQDMAMIEKTRQDIDRNINIGLSVAVLFEGLIDNVSRDQSR